MPQTRLYEVIKQLIDSTPGLTQRGLAARLGLDAAAVHRMLYGQRSIKADEIPVIEAYLGTKLDLQGARGKNAVRGFSEPAAEAFPQVPVYGYAAGSDDLGRKDGELNLANGEVIDYAPPPPGKSPGGIFALYVFSDSMEPRYYRGELIYVHRNRPVHNNRDCVIRMKNGDAHIKQLVRMTEDKIRVRQFNPPAEKDIPLGDVEAVYPVIFRG